MFRSEGAFLTQTLPWHLWDTREVSSLSFEVGENASSSEKVNPNAKGKSSEKVEHK